jgi:hypothetical protein
MERERKAGRPPKYAAGERTRGPLTVRLRDQVRQELDAAAKAAGRSLSEEIEYRVELGLARRDYLHEIWGHDIFMIADTAARSLDHIQQHTGKYWIQDDRTFVLFLRTLDEIVKRYRKRAIFAEEVEPKTDTELVDQFATLGGMGDVGPKIGGAVDMRGKPGDKS